MNINIFCNYEVEMHTKGSNRVGFDEFEKFEETNTQIINGGSLLNILGVILSNNLLISLDIDIENQTIKCELFNPTTGEGEDTTYKIKMIGVSNE